MAGDLEGDVARVIAGESGTAELDRLARAGATGVRALLAGNHPAPAGRALRDVLDDVSGALQAIAARDPRALLEVLAEGPGERDLAWALGASRHEAAVHALCGLLAHRDAGVRWSAVTALGRIGAPRGVEAVARLVRDRGANVRFAALQVVAEHLPAGARDALRSYLARPTLSPGELLAATEALAELEGTPRAVVGSAPEEGTLAALVRGERVIEGHRELASVVGTGAVHAVLDAYALRWERRPAEVRQALGDALQAIGRADAGRLLEVLATRADGAAFVIQALAFVPSDHAADAVAAHAAHPEPHVRWSVAGTLTRIGTPAAAAPLPAMLGDPSLPVQLMALRGVAVHMPGGSREALGELLSREDLVPYARSTASDARSRAAR